LSSRGRELRGKELRGQAPLLYLRPRPLLKEKKKIFSRVIDWPVGSSVPSDPGIGQDSRTLDGFWGFLARETKVCVPTWQPNIRSPGCRVGLGPTKRGGGEAGGPRLRGRERLHFVCSERDVPHACLLRNIRVSPDRPRYGLRQERGEEVSKRTDWRFRFKADYSARGIESNKRAPGERPHARRDREDAVAPASYAIMEAASDISRRFATERSNDRTRHSVVHLTTPNKGFTGSGEKPTKRQIRAGSGSGTRVPRCLSIAISSMLNATLAWCTRGSTVSAYVPVMPPTEVGTPANATVPSTTSRLGYWCTISLLAFPGACLSVLRERHERASRMTHSRSAPYREQ